MFHSHLENSNFVLIHPYVSIFFSSFRWISVFGSVNCSYIVVKECCWPLLGMLLILANDYFFFPNTHHKAGNSLLPSSQESSHLPWDISTSRYWWLKRSGSFIVFLLQAIVTVFLICQLQKKKPLADSELIWHIFLIVFLLCSSKNSFCTLVNNHLQDCVVLHKTMRLG